MKILTQDEVEKLQKKVGGAGGADGDKQQSRDGGQEDRGDRMGSVDRDQGSMDREMRGPGKKNNKQYDTRF